MSSPLPFHSPLVCLVLLLHLSKTLFTDASYVGNMCSKNANYTTGSAFQSNLNHLLSSLSSATPPTGFSNITVGQSSDTVYGLAWCEADVSSEECRSCLSPATYLADFQKYCLLGLSAALWYTHCFLRYSNESFFGVVDTDIKWYLPTTQPVSDVTSFDNVLGKLMGNLMSAAAYRPVPMFAAGSSKLDNLTNIYGLVQCTADLTPQDCCRCLRALMAYIANCCGGRKTGVYLWGLNCYLGYNIFPFYNTSGVSALTGATTAGGGLAPPPQNSSVVGDNSSHGSKLGLVIAIPIATVAVVLLGICFFITWRRREAYRKLLHGGADHEAIRSSERLESLLLDSATLRAATNNFSDANKLGEGGFGPVYKGELGNGEVIAVKRLAVTSSQGLLQLRNEVVLVAKLQHRNLVRLLGCCLEENEKMLVYEYLPNISLDKFLFDPLKRQQLSWQIRFRIIEGIARGLLYLHEDSRLRIVHRDLKASNILLDGNMNPKISDFGLAKLFGTDESQRNTSRIAGTYGYMAPEYAMHGIFSTKSDVFSYGVLVLEVITGRRNTSSRDSSGRAADLLRYVWVHWSEGTVLELRDPILGDSFRTEELLRCIHIGLLCVQEDQAERPSMASVVLMLNSFSITLPAPSTPAFSSATGSEVRSANEKLVLSEKEHSTELKKTPKRSGSFSKNDVTISEMDAR